MSDPVAPLRAIALALPEACEVEQWATPTFRVASKMFAVVDARPGVWLKAAPGSQAHLVEADPKVFYVPPYLGGRGWVGVRLDLAAPAELTVLVRRSYALVAPKRLARLVTE